MNLDGLVVREAGSEDHDSLMALEQKVIDAERPFNASLKEQDAYYYDIEKLMTDQFSRLVVGFWSRYRHWIRSGPPLKACLGA